MDTSREAERMLREGRERLTADRMTGEPRTDGQPVRGALALAYDTGWRDHEAGIPPRQAAVVEHHLASIAAIRAASHPADGAGIRGEDVHAAWRDGMLAQGRSVAAERMTWETLSEEDRQLDDDIAYRLTRAAPPTGSGLDEEAT